VQQHIEEIERKRSERVPPIEIQWVHWHRRNDAADKAAPKLSLGFTGRWASILFLRILTLRGHQDLSVVESIRPTARAITAIPRALKEIIFIKRFSIRTRSYTGIG
jgi:hypothetical protein